MCIISGDCQNNKGAIQSHSEGIEEVKFFVPEGCVEDEAEYRYYAFDGKKGYGGMCV